MLHLQVESVSYTASKHRIKFGRQRSKTVKYELCGTCTSVDTYTNISEEPAASVFGGSLKIKVAGASKLVVS